MSQILFVVDIPPLESGVISSVPQNASNRWLCFEDECKSTTLLAAGTKQLCRNVWLLDAKNGLPTLLALSTLAGRSKLTYTAHLIEGSVVEMTLLKEAKGGGSSNWDVPLPPPTRVV